MRKVWYTALGAVCTSMCLGFSSAERTRVLSYWQEPTRYKMTAPPSAGDNGPWQVRLTAEGSTWLWNYNRQRGVRVPPTQDAGGRTERERVWEAWIQARVERDRWMAAQVAASANGVVRGSAPASGDPEPTEPGPIPEDLLALAGNPPSFAAAAVPMRHEVRFDDGFEVAYHDFVPMRARFAFFRFPQGVMSGGQVVRRLPERELADLLRDAGVSESQGRVLRAVSLLEGGFDSVNTYDTGFVSVGFIQFASLSGGSGALGTMLLRMKTESGPAFEQDFRRFGIDVTDRGILQVLDLTTGALLVGPDAAREVIEDKRLIAVFQRAGLRSRGFRLAQIREAMAQFYPADDAVSILGPSGAMFGRVSDFVKSEAGLATLMDRKVNTGRLDPLVDVVTRVAQARRVTNLRDLASFEREIIEAMRYRKNYLEDPDLGQPPAVGAAPRRTDRRA